MAKPKYHDYERAKYNKSGSTSSSVLFWYQIDDNTAEGGQHRVHFEQWQLFVKKA